MSHASRFWREMERYHDLARRYEEGIERVHPPAVTGRSAGCGFCYHCGWCATSVDYYEHRGESLK